MPWGPLSILDGSNPAESNDGPILWVRPGEQLIPTHEKDSRSPMKRRRCDTLMTLILLFVWHLIIFMLFVVAIGLV